jgi:hypothetical protein
LVETLSAADSQNNLTQIVKVLLDSKSAPTTKQSYAIYVSDLFEEGSGGSPAACGGGTSGREPLDILIHDVKYRRVGAATATQPPIFRCRKR